MAGVLSYQLRIAAGAAAAAALALTIPVVAQQPTFLAEGVTALETVVYRLDRR